MSGAQSAGECLDDDAALSIAEGRHAIESRERAHLEACAECRELVARLAALAEPEARAELGLLGDRFCLLSELGVGPLGVTFRARDVLRESEVAVRRVNLPEGELDSRSSGLTRAIARASTIAHPNVCAVHEAVATNAGLLVVRQIAHGEDLGQLVEREALPVRVAERILSEVARALAAGHRAGVTHGHLDCGNVIVDLGGHVLVTDFGVAEALGYHAHPEAVRAPELAPSQPGTALADVHAFGRLARRVLASVRNGASPALLAIALRAAENDPTRRIPNAEELVERFAALQRAEAPTTTVLAPGTGTSELWSGTILKGRFVVEHEEARGGMGAVFRGRDLETGESVAIKTMLPSLHDVQRFEREARALSELTHDGIVRYVAHGEHAGRRYLVMDWIDGEPLSTVLARRALSLSETVRMARRVAEALSEAHARGIVHRDLKPHNLMLVSADVERTKLVDFGLTRRTGTEPTLTLEGAIVGTPGYMSPEQARGERGIDARTDVFSLGCIMYECLVGRRPFEGRDAMAVLAKVALAPVQPIADVRKDAPPPLVRLVERMLEKNRDARPVDAREVAEALASVDVATHVEPSPVSVPRLTRSEQLTLTVMAGRAGARAGEAALAATERVPGDLLAVVHDEARRRGAGVERLANGAVIAIWRADSLASERLSRVAECALSVRDSIPRARLAIATGVGDIADGDIPIGEVIDRVSALLELECSEAGIPLDDATGGLMAGQFDVREQHGSMWLRGRRPAAERPRSILGKASPCVGRATELAMVAALVDEALTAPTARALLVTGPAGVGKSRLRHEAVQALRERHSDAQVWVAAGDAARDGSPLGFAQGLLRSACGFVDGDSPAALIAKLEKLVTSAELADPGHVTSFISELLGVQRESARADVLAARRDGALMHDHIQRAWQSLLDASSRRHPCVLVLEDLQWGDWASVRLIDSVLRQLSARPLFVLATGRPELESRFPGLWAQRDLSHVRLSPLRPRFAEKLARSLLGEAATDESVRRIVDRAEGNPFYLEELIRSEAHLASELPGSVLAVVRGRLESMEPEARRVLRAASVFGKTFWDTGVEALLGRDSALVGEWLEQLRQRELLDRLESSPARVKYQFRHALVRDAAHSLLTDDDRALGHRLAGEWLEEDGARDAVMLAEHFELGRSPSRARRWWKQAAEDAAKGSDMKSVRRYAGRALQSAAGDEAGILNLWLADAENSMGEHEAAAASARLALTKLPIGSAAWCDAAVQLSESLQTLGDRPGLTAFAAQLLSVRGAVTDRAAFAVACARVVIDLRRCNVTDPIEGLLQVIREHEPDIEPGDTRRRAFLHRHRAMEALYRDDHEALLGELEASVRAFDAVGDDIWAARQRFNLGFFLALFGRAVEGEAVLRASSRTVERLELSHLSSVHAQNLGFALLQQGKLDQAEAMYSASSRMLASAGARRAGGFAHLYLGMIALARSDPTRAEREANAALESFEQSAPSVVPFARALLARVEMALGETARALTFAESALAGLGDGVGLGEGEAYVRLTHAEALHVAGRRSEALESIADAATRLRARASRLRSTELRTAFLEGVAEHNRTLALAAQWGA